MSRADEVIAALEAFSTWATNYVTPVSADAPKVQPGIAAKGKGAFQERLYAGAMTATDAAAQLAAIQSTLSAALKREEGLREALAEMLAAYGPWTGKTGKQDFADQIARTALTGDRG